MPLAPGTKLLEFEITAALGVGGMGEVYRARDTKLGREVAIKVLPEEVSRDRDRLQRFEREAKLLAALNHPNVAHLYGFEESEGTSFLVMELVDGETLAERIARGPIPVEEARALFVQMALGLESAHDNGIVHRDLKPANVKITRDGQVKILDFGLAKAFAADDDLSAETSLSPTLTKGTALGTILGTASYMSPEQAKGSTVDRKTDVWAFGCCLYEALTGKRVFDGETPTDAIAAVVKSDPDWSALAADVSPGLRELLERCLRKDPKRRLHDIADARLSIEEGDAGRATAGAPAARGKWAVVAAVAVVSGAIGFGVAMHRGTDRLDSPATLRLSISAAPEVDAVISVTISPDGERVVYTGRSGDGLHLYLRELDEMDSTRIPGSRGAQGAFFSPDGMWVGYFVGGELRRASVLGGDPLLICDAPSTNPGAAWGEDDTIVYSRDWSTGLMRVPATGGAPEALTELDADSGEAGHWWPVFLPDGKTVLFTIWYGGTLTQAVTAALDLETGDRRTLFDGARARYAPSGHVVYYHRGGYQAMGFDASRLQPTSEPRPILSGTRRQQPNGANEQMLGFSRTGTLVSIPGDDFIDPSSLVWVDRDGTREPLPFEADAFREIELAPDGNAIAVTRVEEGSLDVWIYDLERGIQQRLTRDGSNFGAIWHPTEPRLAFGSTVGGSYGVFVTELGPTAPVDVVVDGPRDEIPYAWSPDGSSLAVTETSPDTADDIWIVNVDNPTEKRLLVRTPAREMSPRFSRDGDWIAFASRLSGEWQVYVQSTRDPEKRERISTAGGAVPLWSPTRNELYFRTRERAMVVRYETDGVEFHASPPEALVDLPPSPRGTELEPWDIAPDGERFLVLAPSPDAPPADELYVTTNWFDELRRVASMVP